MEEVKKIKPISVAVVLVILAIIVALLNYEQPKHLFSESAESSLNKIVLNEFLINKSEITDNTLLIDVRSIFDFNKGHIEKAVNISLPDLLIDENIKQIKDAAKDGKTIVFYGNDPNEALSAHMLIQQLGYADSKVLSVTVSYNQNELLLNDVIVEKDPENIQAFIDKSVKDAAAPKIEIKPVVKKVITKKKKKKIPDEGGC